MLLGLIITAHCNASCSHCSTSCGPQRRESLPSDKIFSLMDEAAVLAAGKPLSFLLTGGEPFLDFARLLSIVAYGHRLGAVMTCVTNASWATSDGRARTRLAAIKAAGLSDLGISTSRFHQQFIKRQRVERALAAAREVGLRCTLKYARARTDTEDVDAVRAWALAAGAVAVQDFDLLPHLREGTRLPEAEYPRDPGLPEGRCPAALLTVREDGKAFTCCTPGSQADLLALGNVHELSLHELQGHYYLGGTQQILRESGPIVFARAIQAGGLGSRLRGAYAGVCDLCVHIATDPEMAAVAAAVSRDHEVRQLQDLVEGLVTKIPAMA